METWIQEMFHFPLTYTVRQTAITQVINNPRHLVAGQWITVETVANQSPHTLPKEEVSIHLHVIVPKTSYLQWMLETQILHKSLNF